MSVLVKFSGVNTPVTLTTSNLPVRWRLILFSYNATVIAGLELSGGWGGSTPQYMSTDAHFWVKMGIKFQSLGKISNILTSDPPVLLGQFRHCVIDSVIEGYASLRLVLQFCCWSAEAEASVMLTISLWLRRDNTVSDVTRTKHRERELELTSAHPSLWRRFSVHTGVSRTLCSSLLLTSLTDFANQRSSLEATPAGTRSSSDTLQFHIF